MTDDTRNSMGYYEPDLQRRAEADERKFDKWWAKYWLIVVIICGILLFGIYYLLISGGAAAILQALGVVRYVPDPPTTYIIIG